MTPPAIPPPSLLTHIRIQPMPSDFGLKQLTAEQICERLARFERRDFIATLSNVGLAMTNAGCSDFKTQIDVGRVLIPPELYERAWASMTNPRCGMTFHPGQVRDLVRMMLSIPANGTDNINSPGARLAITECLLSVGIATEPPAFAYYPKPFSFLDFYLTANHKVYLETDTVRTLFASTVNSVEFLLAEPDIRNALIEHMGYPPEMLLWPHFMMHAFFSRYKTDQLNISNGAACDMGAACGRFGVSRAAYDKFMADNVLDVTQIYPYPADEGGVWPFRDYSVLYRKPFATARNGNLVIADSEFAQQRMSLVLKDALRDILGGHATKTAFGDAFNAYVLKLLNEYKSDRRGVRLSDRYPKDLELDAGWAEGDTAVLAEVKSTIIPLQIAFGKSVDAVIDFVHERIIGYDTEGHRLPGAKRALAQLIDRVHAQIRDPKSFGLGRRRSIVALLVVQDKSVSDAWINSYLAYRFYELIGDTGKYEVRFCAVHISEFEGLVAFRRGGAMADGLLSFARFLKGERMSANRYIFGYWQDLCNTEPINSPDSLKVLDDAMHFGEAANDIPDGPQCSSCNDSLTTVETAAGQRFACLTCTALRIEPPRQDELELMENVRLLARAKIGL